MQGRHDAEWLKPAEIAIDPRLEPASVTADFRRLGRIHIPGFLTPASAAALHQALAGETEWRCSTMGSGKTIDFPVATLEAFRPEQTIRFITLAHAEARDGFHYMFDTLRITDLVEAGEPVSPMLAAAHAFLNSDAFLGFVRALTGDPRPNYVDAQATRYEAGHYLTEHDDLKPESGRLYAYVLNLTPKWRVDWGGVLTFIDEDGHVAEGYTPAWNALNLFRVPQAHAVSCLAPFAGAPRLSITGWVRHIDPGSLARKVPASPPG
ncbi:MAG TPA: 2OG-Fe(II) oxygenase family protein [Caulobacter sp.]|nr:2OG-Fe(II) oxygenase family protein [Caulobacter sp.]